jgi:hypothetical protein
MASILAPANPPPRLTDFALRRHTRAKAKALRTPSEIENAPSSTDLDGWAEVLEEREGMTHISIDSEERKRIKARGRRFHKFINGVERREKSPVPTYVTDDRPIWMRTQGRELPEPNIPKSVHEITPRLPAAMFRSQSINLPASSDNDATRLIKSISAEGEQSLNIVVSHLPQFRHVRNHGEMGSYIDQSQYAICMGSGPLRDLQYGIIIVPIGEEQMMFRPEHEYRDEPISNRQEPQHHSAILQDSVPNPVLQVRPPQEEARNNIEASLRIPFEAPGLFGRPVVAARVDKGPLASPKSKPTSSRVTKKVPKGPPARSQPKKTVAKAKSTVKGAKALAPQPTPRQRRSPRANAGRRAT